MCVSFSAFKETTRRYATNESDSGFNQSSFDCKTPIAEFKTYRRPPTSTFTTSTPISNNKQNLLHSEVVDLNRWFDSDTVCFDEFFEDEMKPSLPPPSSTTTTTIMIEGKSHDDVMHISDIVKNARREALNQQEGDCCNKDTHSIRPSVGYHFTQKSLSSSSSAENSKRLHELGTPKPHERDELVYLGVMPNVIDVNADNALEFKFEMWNFYPLDVCRKNMHGIDMHGMA